MTLSKIDLLEIETQLSCPNGEDGVAIGEKMNQSNSGMTRASVDALNIVDRDTVLEIGPHNGAHLIEIIERHPSISYTGLEISQTMKEEAQKINSKHILNHKINFMVYDGSQIPFKVDTFDKILSVNTIYFWENPTAFLEEIKRVLKQTGVLVLTFAKKDFMQELPFVNKVFTLYNLSEFANLIKSAGFSISELMNKVEQVKSKTDVTVEREYMVCTLKFNKS